jgi:hypothetical protein
MNLEDKIDWALVVGLSASLFLLLCTGGCATIPKDVPCDYHATHPEVNRIEMTIIEACVLAGNEEACAYLNNPEELPIPIDALSP